MHDRRTIGGGTAQRLDVGANVASDRFKIAVRGRVALEAAHRVAVAQQPVDRVAADQTRGAGDQNRLAHRWSRKKSSTSPNPSAMLRLDLTTSSPTWKLASEAAAPSILTRMPRLWAWRCTARATWPIVATSGAALTTCHISL